MRRFFSLFERFDWTLLTAALTLTAIGLVAIYGIGVSQEPAGLFPFYKQLVAGLLGLIVMLALVFIDYRHLRSLSLLAYLGGAGLLVLVLVFGQTIRGTQGWFRVGGLSFQPVEIAKIALTLYLAALFARRAHGRLSWSLLGLSACATFAYAGLVLLQPDFGSAMIMIAIWGVMALFTGLPRRAWIILPLVALVAGGLVWSVGLKPYQRARLVSFLHPEKDPRGSSYNAAQARIAIGSGGLLGKGLGAGSQARLRFLPEAATDFIFAVIGEELGFIGVGVVLGLFMLMLYRYIHLAGQSRDDFAALFLIGLAATFFIHVVVNAGMNLGIMPITGIPLPFLSAAASYLTVTFISVGCAESVAVRRQGMTEKDHLSF